MTRVKKSWGIGPWDDELDRDTWVTAAGLHGVITRNSAGAWCGYIAIPKDHPHFGEGIFDVEDIQVHGGVTWADNFVPIITKIKSKDFWWFGFDCAHGGDLIPSIALSEPDLWGERGGNVYRNEKFVRDEVESLASQLLNASELKADK